MDKRIRIGGIIAAIIFAILIWVSPSNPPPIPEPGIINGFDWEFDNTHPYEFDSQCLDMEFYKIKNGWMTTCYPENFFMGNDPVKLMNLLKIIKDL